MLKRIVCLLLLGLCLAGSASAAEGAKNPTLVIETNLGAVKVELFQKEAPISVKNFLDYAKAGFYNGTIFHRVIPGFMIQGGGFTARGSRAPRPVCFGSAFSHNSLHCRKRRGSGTLLYSATPVLP